MNSLYAGADEDKTPDEPKVLPSLEPLSWLTSADSYIADPGLRDAVNVALLMGQPLLITGEPGTGKTQLAASIAHEFKQPDSHSTPLLTFHTKSTSTAKDVFYHYDALRHFHAANHSKALTQADDYISYEALGLAILLSLAPDDSQRDETVNKQLPLKFQSRHSVRSIVLIDEVDKAPRDLPNDVLNEFENMTFTVSETRRTFKAAQDFRPVLILTSNSEKDLPDAFLRRCIFYHIDFPNHERLMKIVNKRLKLNSDFTQQHLDAAISHFEKIRNLSLKKKPATAELLSWLYVLQKQGIDVNSRDEETKRNLSSSYSLLAKYKQDKDSMNSFIKMSQQGKER